MFINYLQVLKQYKKQLLASIIIVAVIISGPTLVKKAKIYNSDYKFEKALAQASAIDSKSWDKKYNDSQIKDKYKIVFISNDGGGDYAYAENFKIASKKIGWEVKLYTESEYPSYVDEMLAFDPDFMIILSRTDKFIDVKTISHRSKKYIIELSPLRFLRSFDIIQKNNLYQVDADFYGLISKSDALLASAQEVDFYRNIFEKMGKSFNGFRLLPLVASEENKAAEPERIIWFGRDLNDLSSEKNYKKFITALSENIPMKIYGRQKYTSYLNPHIYDGYIPNAAEISNAIRKNGIYLLTHARRHTKESMPTLRIFEAVAANAVVISDKNPFALEHFGDSFLYFDQNANGETMYKQVKAHYDWIKANPEKAKAMAERAHQIFLEKFTLEKDLIRIAQMHEYILLKDKEMGYTYPPVY